MKHLLCSLIATVLLTAGSAPAQLYPVLTDSSARTFPGGATNVFFLNSNAVATGNFRATGAVTLTNSGNVFAGDGSGLTGVGAGTNGPLLNGTNIWTGTNTFTGRLKSSGAIVGRTSAEGSAGNAVTYGIGSETTGFYDFAAGYIAVSSSGSAKQVFGGAVAIDSAVGLGWSTSVTTVGVDVNFNRVSAGLLELNNGTTGQYRDLLARSLYATNLYATNLIINGGATVTGILSATATLDFNLTAVDVEDLTITVTGAAVGNVVSLGVPHGSVTATAQFTGWVSAADTVTVRCRVAPGAGENPASGTFRATVIKH
jgi:hypothetical protein